MKIWECMKSVNDKAGLGDIIRNKSVHSDLRHALQEMLYFTAEVIGTDGARQKLGSRLRLERMEIYWQVLINFQSLNLLPAKN